MKRFVTIAKTYYNAALVYRFNFALWRLRNIFMILSLYYLWTAVFSETNTLFNYTKSQILTYIFFSSFLKASILSTRAVDIVGEIHSGNLSNLLIKPISVIKYYFARDLSDKAFNIFFSIVELGLLLALFRPTLAWSNSYLYLGLSALSICIAFLFNFYLNFFIGSLGFWVLQVWPIMFIAQLFSQIVSGALFPLDIFPQSVTRIMNLTPFPYLIFFPTNLFLGRISLSESIQGIGVSIIWVVIFYFLTQKVLQKGIKNYSAFGN